MRNPDYRAMYEKVCERAKAEHDAVGSPQTQKAIQDNKARRIGNAIETPNKRSGTPTEPPKPQIAEEIQEIGAEIIAGMTTDELWQLMAYLDEATPADFAGQRHATTYKQPKETSSGRQAGRAAFQKPKQPVTGTLKRVPMNPGTAKDGKPPMI